MSKEAIENTFTVTEMMEELKDIFRQTAPLHNLSPSQREDALKLIGAARAALDKLEASL